MKQIQIDEELFRDLLGYFFNENAPDDYNANLIRQQLNDKLDRLIAREIFTKYKKAVTSEEREKYRKEYLEHRGISSKFISNTEIRE